MTTDYTKGLYKEYERLLTENEEIKMHNRVLKTTETLLQKEIARRQKAESDPCNINVKLCATFYRISGF